MKRSPIKPKPRKTGNDFTTAARNEIRFRSNGFCEICFVARAVHFHHRLRRSQGGLGTVENGLHLCGFHHQYVHANPAESYEKGWLLRHP